MKSSDLTYGGDGRHSYMCGKFKMLKSQKGQTLVEVVAGLGMLAIVVIALIGMGVVALKTSSSARNRTVAAKLANEGMELVRSERDQNTWDDFVVLTWSDQNITVGSVDFTRKTAVTATADSGKKKIVVTVEWPESSGTKSVSVTSYLTDWR